MSVVGDPSVGRPGAAAPDRTTPGGVAAGLICLGLLGILGSAVQLTVAGPGHLLPWTATILLVSAAALIGLPRPGRHGRAVARSLCLVVLVSVATAVVEHLTTGPGGTVGPVTRSWYGGGTAPLVPGLLGQSAILLLLAGLRAGPLLGRVARRIAPRTPRPGSRGDDPCLYG